MINEPKDIGYNYQVKQKFNFYHMDQVDWNTQFLEIPYRLQILHRWGEQFGGKKYIRILYLSWDISQNRKINITVSLLQK